MDLDLGEASRLGAGGMCQGWESGSKILGRIHKCRLLSGAGAPKACTLSPLGGERS